VGNGCHDVRPKRWRRHGRFALGEEPGAGAHQRVLPFALLADAQVRSHTGCLGGGKLAVQERRGHGQHHPAWQWPLLVLSRDGVADIGHN
jgi:hypothetical protein